MNSNSQRMVVIKSEHDVPQSLKDFVQFQIVNDTVEAVIVQVGSEYIRITKADSYGNSLRVAKEQGKIKVERYALKGKFLGLVDVYEEFGNEHEATSKMTEYKTQAGYAENHGLSIEKVTVEVEPDKI